MIYVIITGLKDMTIFLPIFILFWLGKRHHLWKSGEIEAVLVSKKYGSSIKKFYLETGP